MAELRKKLDFTRQISAPDVLFENNVSLNTKASEWDLNISNNTNLIKERTLYENYTLDEVPTYEDGHYVLIEGEYITAVGQTTGDTYSKSESTIKDKINSINTDASALEERVKSNEDALSILNGDSTVEGSVANSISKVIDSAPEAFDTLKEVADWIAKDESGTEALIGRVTTNETELDELHTNLKWDSETKDAVRITDIETSISNLVATDSDKTIREIAEDAIALNQTEYDASIKEWVKSAEGAKNAVYGNVLVASYPDGIGTRTTGLIENRTVVYTTTEVVDNVETTVEHTVELGSTPFTPEADGGYTLNAKDGSTHKIIPTTPLKIYATDVNIATAISSLEHAVEVASENHELEAAGLESRIEEIEDTIGGSSGTSLVDRITALEEANAADDEADAKLEEDLTALINERTQYDEFADDGVTNLTVKDKIAQLEANTSITSDQISDLIDSFKDFFLTPISYWRDESGIVSEFVEGSTYTALTDASGESDLIIDTTSYVAGDNKSGNNIDLDAEPQTSKTVNFNGETFESAVYTYSKGTITVTEDGHVTFVPNSAGAGEVYDALISSPEDASSRLDRIESDISKNTNDINDLNTKVDNVKDELIASEGNKFQSGTITKTKDSLTIDGTEYFIYEYFGNDWDFTSITPGLEAGKGIYMVLDSYALVSEVYASDETKAIIHKLTDVLLSEDGGVELLPNTQFNDFSEMYTVAKLVNAKFLVRDIA